MARHSHWAQIKLKKGALDKKRGKIFSKHAHLIETAARIAGGDPNMNANLRLLMENARADNMPKENIERAIKKGIGELEGDATEEITYEGYGPAGVAIIIDTLTDNKNRTSQMLRRTFQEYGGTMGGAGSTSFLFEKKAQIIVNAKSRSDSDELELIDAGAQDIAPVEGNFFVFASAAELFQLKKEIASKGFSLQSAELVWMPKNLMEVSEDDKGKITTLLEALEENPDVVNVAVNCTF